MLMFFVLCGATALGNSVQAQDTLFFRHLFERVSDRSVAKSYMIVTYQSGDSLQATETTYYMNGQVKQITPYIHYKKREKHGEETRYYDNNRLYSSQHFAKGKEEGKHLVYYSDGSLKREDVYSNGRLEKGRCIGVDGKDTSYFDFYKEGAYPGGNLELVKFIAQNVKYPKKALEEGLQGVVVVSFVVTEKGDVINYEIRKSLSPETDAEALRVSHIIRRFQPSEFDGEAIASQYFLPFRFSMR